MSKIAVVVDDPAPAAGTVGLVRAVTGQGVAEIGRRMRSGQPVAEYTLFENDHDDVAARLRRLSAEIAAAGLAMRIYELDDSESLEGLDDPTVAEISVQSLNDILDAHEEELERQRALSEQGR